MFKNFTSRSALRQLFTKASELAKESKLVVRRSKRFCPQAFLFSLLQSVVDNCSSYQQLCVKLGDQRLPQMSRQSMHERVGENSSSFLLSVLKQAILGADSKHYSVGDDGGFFPRIIIEDSTVIPMQGSNHEHFAGSGRGGKNAGAKINYVIDLRSQRPLKGTLHPASCCDQSLARDVFSILQEDDLLVRDRGYFGRKHLAELSERKVHWVSRLPAMVKAITFEGRDIDTLFADDSRSRIDETVTLGAGKDQIQVRLVALRLSPQKAESMRRRANTKAKSHGNKRSKRAILRDGWEIYVTNLSEDQYQADQIANLYAMRWDIEMEFRAIKGSINLSKVFNRRLGKFQAEALLYSIMILAVISRHAYQVVAKVFADMTLSREKVYRRFAILMLKTISFHDAFRLLVETIERDPRSLRLDTGRATRSLQSKKP